MSQASFASMHGLAVAAGVVVLVGGCTFAPTPSSTSQSPSGDVWVRWENRTREAYVITVLGNGDVTPQWEEAAPCRAGEMRADADDPFAIGIASWDADFSRPGRTVADDEAYREAGGRLLLIIEEGPSPDEPAVNLDTWVGQRSSLPESCP